MTSSRDRRTGRRHGGELKLPSVEGAIVCELVPRHQTSSDPEYEKFLHNKAAQTLAEEEGASALRAPKPSDPHYVRYLELIDEIAFEHEQELRARGLLPPRPQQNSFDAAAIVVQPKGETKQRRKTVEIGGQYDRVLTKDGVRYRPLPDAARLAGVPRQTMLNWIKGEVSINGHPLNNFYHPAVDTYFVAEESIERAANRFVKLPFNEHAGPVTIGKTDDQSGYLAMSDAAKMTGVSRQTMWAWCGKQQAPGLEKPLDTVKCTVSNYVYVSERDVANIVKPQQPTAQRQQQPSFQP